MSLAGAAAEALHRTFLSNWRQAPGWIGLAAALAIALRWTVLAQLAFTAGAVRCARAGRLARGPPTRE